MFGQHLDWLLEILMPRARHALVVALSLVFAGAAHAASSSLKIPGGGQVLVDAKYAARDYDKGTLELSGDVILMYNQQYMSCDRAVINERTHIIEAVGNVVISSPQAYAEGSRAAMNYGDNTGTIENGFVKSGPVIFQGTTVRKTGLATYEADNSYFTACTNCPATWSFNGTRMKAEVGGYASIKNPIMRIANIPVFWLPYLLVPLKSERQSGFLIPTIEYSGDDGAVLGLRYFWAINRSQDATFTIKSYSRRGEKALLDYRYMLSETSKGEFNGAFIRDSIFPTVAGAPVDAKNNRWFIDYTHRYELPYGITQNTDVNLVSDLFYTRDFAVETNPLMGPRGDPALENKISVTRNGDNMHTSVEADYFINTLKESPVASNSDQVHKWPEFRYAVTDTPLFNSHLLFSFNADYTNFVRDDVGYDTVAQQQQAGAVPSQKQLDLGRNGQGVDVNGNPVHISDAAGNFDPRYDIIRTGQRLDLSPQLAYPFALGKYIDVLPSIQYRHTQYAFNVSAPNSLIAEDPNTHTVQTVQGVPYDTTPYRAYTFGRVSMRTHLYRTFGGGAGLVDEPKREVPPSPEPTSPLTNWVDQESNVGAKPLAVPERPSIYRHEMIPEIIGTYMPYVNQPGDSPFFQQGAQLPLFLQDEPISNDNFLSPTPPGSLVAGAAQAPTNIQFDYYDRLTTRTTLTGLVTNRLVRKRYRGDGSDYNQVLSWKVGESYDFTEASRDQDPKLPWSDVSSQLDVQLDQFSMNSIVRYFPYHNVTDSYSYVRLKNAANTNFIELSFTRSYDITRYVSQTLQSTPDTLGVATGFTTKYVDATGSLNFNPPDVLSLDNYPLTSWSTDFRIRPPGNCWVFKVHYDQQFAGPHSIGFDFEYNFGGTTG